MGTYSTKTRLCGIMHAFGERKTGIPRWGCPKHSYLHSPKLSALDLRPLKAVMPQSIDVNLYF